MTCLEQFEKMVCDAYDSKKIYPTQHNFSTRRLLDGKIVDCGCAIGAAWSVFCEEKKDVISWAANYLSNYQIDGVIHGFDDSDRAYTENYNSFIGHEALKEYEEGYALGEKLRLKYIKQK